MLNAFAEQKAGVLRAVKRPALVGEFSAMQGGAGSGQWLFSFSTPEGVETLAGIQNDVLDNSPTPIASRLAFSVQPADWKVSTAISPSIVVQARDLTGAVKTSFTGDVTLSFASNPNSGTLSGTLTVAAIAGVATFSNVKIDRVGGGYTLKASASLMRTATSSVFKIVSNVSFTVQPSANSPNTTFNTPVEVSVVDSSSNVITGYVGNITIAIGTNPSGGTLSGTLTVAAVSGVASFTNLSIDQIGNGYTLVASASAGGLASVTSDAFSISNPYSVACIGLSAQVFGYDIAVGGSITPTTFGGSVIRVMKVDIGAATKVTTLTIAGVVAQSFFTSMSTTTNVSPDTVRTLLSASATSFSTGSGNSVWTWEGASGSDANWWADNVGGATVFIV